MPVVGAVRIGVFLGLASWFCYTFYRFALGITTQIISFTDVPATVGLGFRTAAGFIAVIAALFYLARRDLSSPEFMISVRWIVILETLYFLSFVPSAVWGFNTVFSPYPREILVVSTGLPCLVEAIIVPIVLVRLFFELSPNKSDRGVLRWAMIAGVAYLFVFWFNYTMQWIATLIQKGFRFITLYPVNALGFSLTVIGLLLLLLFATASFKKVLEEKGSSRFSSNRIGIIVVALGLYFDLTFLLWLLFGSVGGYNMWHTFFVYHNVDLWCMALPLTGVPLLFHTRG